MAGKVFTKEEISKALESARHAANGAIEVWALSEPDTAGAMRQIRDIYEEDMARMLAGKRSLTEENHAQTRPTK